MRMPVAVMRALFFVLLALVTYLTLTPNPDDTKEGFAVARWVANLLFGDAALTDKVAHFLGYAALGASAYWAELKLVSRRWATGAALVFYGVALEGLQGLGGVRSPEIADAIANGIGAAAGIAGACVLVLIFKKIRGA